MSYRWNPRESYPSYPVTLPPNKIDQLGEYIWKDIENTPQELMNTDILQYKYTDWDKCIMQYYCALPLAIAIVIFAYLSIFILTLCVLYVISSMYGLLSQCYCILYQMYYFVSPSRWKVSESELEKLRQTILMNRDVANQRFRSLDDEKLQIHKYLRTFGM